MQYEFEIVSSPESKFEVCVACMFEEERLYPVAYLNLWAKKHFGDLGVAALGDRLDLHRFPVGTHAPSAETVFCSAAFVVIDGVPTVQMIAGPIMRQELYGHA